jgi:hypothetical protein
MMETNKNNKYYDKFEMKAIELGIPAVTIAQINTLAEFEFDESNTINPDRGFTKWISLES